ncbi:RNA recognition motif domain [Lasallia pustulata]|uniref:RNA recognition motif domain n=1 Tax=Lasallia pustulata TaxID=136370 RepID=A0A1W5D5Q0_9LECA|nr:RNA recognition motif domain [Lasallia pustulata]
MNRSAATPDKSNQTFSKEVSKVAVPYLDPLTSSANGKQPSPQGPSPASTYGDTATGDSVPPTPIEGGGRDHGYKLVRSRKCWNLHRPDESSLASPVASPLGKGFAQSDLLADTAQVTFANGSPSRTKTGSARNSAFNTVSAGPSPTVRRYEDSFESPSSRRPMFVHQHDLARDPFSTPNTPKSAVQQGGARFLPRADRANLELTGDTAQALLPPDACVFIANLSSFRTDYQLEISVHDAFVVFGNCYVKIRRDSHGMPFAFCQYENVADAQKAINQGRGITIDNRPCRTERAKVNRSLYLSEASGQPISESEARRILTNYGDIEKLWHSSPTDKEMHRLPEGIWVTFAYYQDCRDALPRILHEQPRFRLEQPSFPNDTHRRTNRPMQAGLSGISPSPPSCVHQRARDSCIIYVGNLPPHVRRDRLEALFAQYGQIRNCELIFKGSPTVQSLSVFAFIEFAAESQARAVLIFDGVRLRIKLKESADRRVSGVASSGSSHANVDGYGQNGPRANADGYGQNGPRANVDRYGQIDPRASVYQYAILLGFDPAIAAPLLMLGHGTPMTSPMYSPYSYYGSPYGYGHQYARAANGTNGSPGMQGNAQDGSPQVMGHFQYPQGQVPYSHYQPLPYYQQHNMINSTGPAADTTGNGNGTEGTQ